MKQNKIPRNEYIIKPKGKTNPYKDDVVYSNLGQWKYPGQVTKIPSNQITMQGVNYPVQGIDDTGYSQMMYPGMDYTFPGEYVTEYPMARYGGGLPKAQDGFNKRLPDVQYNKKQGSQYDPITQTVYIDSNDPEDPNKLLDHELWHHYQNVNNWLRIPEDFPTMQKPQTPASDEEFQNYYNRKLNDINELGEGFKNRYPEFNFVPNDVIYDRKLNDVQYQQPWTMEGEGRASESENGLNFLSNEGYDVNEYIDLVNQVKNKYPIPKELYGGLPRAQNGRAQTPEEWGKEIRNVEHQIGNPSTWTLDSHKMLQDKLNEYKAWRENTPEGKAVIDYHNEPNEYVVPLPPHLQTVPKKPFGGIHTKTDTHMATGGWLDTMQVGGQKPWGEMTAQERTAYLNAKEANAKAEKQSTKQATKEHYQDYVKDSMKKTLEHPMFNTAQYFTPEGMAVGAIKGLADLGPDVAKGDYSAAALDALTALPAVAPAAKNILGLKTKNFKPQNLDVPPPPSYEQYAASNLDPVSQRVWQQQPIINDFIITPETKSLINSGKTNSSWGNYVVPDINSPSPWEAFIKRQAKDAKLIRNRSGLTKEQALERFAGKDKEALSKMSEKEFEETVIKPTGEVVKYKPGPEVDQMGYNADLRNMQLKNAIPMSNEEYRNMFNERLDLLNNIIAKNNKSGVNYTSKGLNEYNQLVFETPEQLVKKQLTEKQIANIEKFNKNPKETLIELGNFRKGKNGKWESDIDHETFDNIEDAVTHYTPLIYAETAPQTIKGTSSWDIGINPGQWRGEVEDIANSEYYKSIPGLDMRNTSSSVFADRIPRRGTGTYESINEYLKGLDLGRVKPGFNSQSDFSKSLWENSIKKGNAFGFYNNPNTVYGAMKSALPYVGTGAIGAAALQQEKYGGWLDKYQNAGSTGVRPIQDNTRVVQTNFPKNLDELKVEQKKEINYQARKQAEQLLAINNAKNKETQYQKDLKEGNVPWYEKRASFANNTPEEQVGIKGELARLQTIDNQRSTQEKLDDASLDVLTSIVPELPLLKYIKPAASLNKGSKILKAAPENAFTYRGVVEPFEGATKLVRDEADAYYNFLQGRQNPYLAGQWKNENKEFMRQHPLTPDSYNGIREKPSDPDYLNKFLLNGKPSEGLPYNYEFYKNTRQPKGKMEGIGDIEDIKRSLMKENEYLKPSEYNSKAIPFSSYKPQAGGYTDVPEFNQELNSMLTKLQYGKRPTLTKENFYNKEELNKLTKQYKDYHAALSEYEKANPQSGASMMMGMFSNENPYMNTFHNLNPNLKEPNWGEKFLGYLDDSKELNTYLPNAPGVRTPLSPDALKYMGSSENKLVPTAKNLVDNPNAWFHKANKKDYVNEMRGSLNLKLSDIKNMSEKELETTAQKIFNKIENQKKERYLKDVSNPYTGIDAYQNLQPNKYGGLNKKEGGWLDDEFRRGGQKGLKSYTSKNIQSSINDIMLRNETLFGPAGKKRYKANVKYKDGGNWLDNMY